MGKYYLFQTDDPEIMFRPFGEIVGKLEHIGVQIGEGHYRCVESGEFSLGEKTMFGWLEDMYVFYNLSSEERNFRSMSVSDIVLIEDEDDMVEPYKAYYVNTVGFEKLWKIAVTSLAIKVRIGRTSEFELLNLIIENLLVSERPRVVAEYLLSIGFAEEDLTRFNFTQNDIEEAMTAIVEDENTDDVLCSIDISRVFPAQFG